MDTEDELILLRAIFPIEASMSTKEVSQRGREWRICWHGYVFYACIGNGVIYLQRYYDLGKEWEIFSIADPGCKDAVFQYMRNRRYDR